MLDIRGTMGKRRLCVIFLLFLFIIRTGVSVSSGQEKHSGHYLEDRVIIAAERRAGTDRAPELGGYGICRMEWIQESQSGEKKIDFYSGYLEDGRDVEEVIRELEGADGIVCAEPDYICYSLSSEKAFYPFDDSIVGERWHLGAVRASEAWKQLEDRGIRPGEGTIVAVVDTGVSLNHPALINNIWKNGPEALGEKGADDDGNGYVDDIYGVNLVNTFTNMTDSCGHGTQMAGIIGMQAGAGASVGIAYASRIMPVKIGTDRNFGTDAAVEGIRYAAANGADVINMSFGTYHDSLLLRTAIQDASEHCMLVSAAGNESLPTENGYLDGEAGNLYPAAYPEVVGVMAMDMQEEIGSYSNWDADPGEGAEYEMAAPGSAVYSTLPGGKYDTVTGTSPAAAMVSGAMAIYRSMYPDREKFPAPRLQKLFLQSQIHTIQHRASQSVKLHYKRLDLPDLVDSWLSGTTLPSEDPVKPEESAKPEESPAPTESVEPEESMKPVGSPAPTESAKPEKSVKPAGPPAPAESVEPEEGVQQAEKELKRFQASRVILKRSYGKKKRKVILCWRFSGGKVNEWYIYRSSRRNGGYKLWKKTERKKITVICGRKKMFYRVAASGRFGGKTVKSKKSGVILCTRI